MVKTSEFAALVAEGDQFFQAGNRRAASAFYSRALAKARSGQTFDRGVAQAVLARLREIERGFAVHLDQALDAVGLSASERHPRFAKSLAILTGQLAREDTGEKFLRQPTGYYYPDLPYCEFYDTDELAWAPSVLAQAEAIRTEALALMDGGSKFGAYVRRAENRPQGDVHGMLENADWSTFDLTRRGVPVPERIAQCPATWETISAHAPQCHVPNRAPTVMFSLLKACSRIPPHHGTLNPRLICHLPLIVPGDGALRVGSQVREWRMGEMLVFDDTVEHEAWNDSRKDRLVLIFDIWHPDLSAIERDQIAALFSAVDSY